MAPQNSDVPPVANVLSTIGTVLWCMQLIPQIWHNWRRKDTTGLPGSMMMLWCVSSVPFGAYDTVQNFAIPLIIQPQIFGTLALLVWAQCMYYGKGWSLTKTWLVSIVLWLVLGGIEALLILTLRPVIDRGVEWPIQLIGAIAALLLVLGFVPAMVEIAHRRGRVVGISMFWCGTDQGTFDILGGVLYIAVAATELFIFLSQGIWLLRTRQLHKRAKQLGQKFDDLPEARKYQWGEKTYVSDDEESQVEPRVAGDASNEKETVQPGTQA